MGPYARGRLQEGVHGEALAWVNAMQLHGTRCGKLLHQALWCATH